MSKRKDVRQEQTEIVAPDEELSLATEMPASPTDIAAASAEPQSSEAAKPKIELAAAAEETASAVPGTAESALPKATTPYGSNRFALLAASVAMAAAVGAVIGSLSVLVLARGPAADHGQSASLAKVTTDLAALRTSIEASNRLANTHFTKISERLDRAQAEPTAKLAALTETVSRLEQRIAAAPAQDVTGSIAAGNTVAKDASKPTILEGWVLRDAYRGRALVENRYGLYEVTPGSNLPGIGRIETITQQNGRWVVVTPKGLIVSMR